MIVLVGVWVVAIILVRSLGLLAIRYTLLPATAPQGRNIRIMAGRSHDAILHEIKTRWRERFRKLRGSINFGNDAEKELAKFSWLKQHNVITEDESGAIARLRQHGFELVAWDLDPDAGQELRGRGADAAGSPAEVAARTEIVISMISADDGARRNFHGAGGYLEAAIDGKLFIEMSTLQPMTVRELAAAAAARR